MGVIVITGDSRGIGASAAVQHAQSIEVTGGHII